MSTELSTELIVRDARDDERGAIKAVTLAAYAEYATRLPPPFWAACERQLLATLDAVGPIQRLVAVRGGEVVGSVLLFAPGVDAYGRAGSTGTRPEVRLLVVVPAARGQGVGTALMEACQQRARQMGAPAIGLHTLDVVQTAKRMYERMGFERAPELDFRPVDAMVVQGFRLRLDDGQIEEVRL